MERTFYDRDGNIIDFYSILNIEYTAGLQEIRSAFRSLIKLYHPDTSRRDDDKMMEKIDLILRGYRILCDTDLKEKYDLYLFRGKSPEKESYLTVPGKRIKYSATLRDMLKIRLLPRGIKRKDILYNFGQDIEIFVTAVEARKGALAYIELPARMQCPLCFGRAPQCHICHGIGRIATTAKLEVSIPPGTVRETVIDVDLMSVKPDRFTSFRGKNLRIKISIQHEE